MPEKGNVIGPRPLRLCCAAILAMLLLLGAAQLSAAVPVPALSGRVVDTAGVLDPAAKSSLEGFLAGFEKQTSNQIAVLIIPSLEEEPPEEYAIRAAREWGLGTKENSNGVLLLVVTQDRKIRIEVGRGLEGALPDALCGRIIRNEMAPLLPKGGEKWAQAVQAGVTSLAQATKGEYKGTGKTNKKSQAWVVGVIAALIFLGIVGVATKLWVSGTLGGVSGAAAGSLLTGNVMVGLLGAAAGVGLGFLVPWLFGSARSHTGGGGGWSSGGGYWGGGSSWGGGSDSSWGGGSDSSWGDFSGGGGSFDGGGCSGDF